ncbi:MAG: LTA synthase family protein [Lachnospiraceae bacterium]|jgi:phosphoglycerol transferase MdoB-like AlkP superfamily enzyme|nr:LTA synthase family protein [Lachnospiraceae bacterium]
MNSSKKILSYGRNIVGFLVFPVLTFFCMESFTHQVFQTMKTPMILLNFVFYYLVAALFFSLIGSLKYALMTETLLVAILGLANFFVYRFRSVPILPWDIYSLRTAASVSTNYDYSLRKETLLVLFAFVCILVAEFLVVDFKLPATKKREQEPKKRKRNGIARLVLTLVFVIAINRFTVMFHQQEFISKMHIYDKLFTPDTMQYKNGNALAFLMELKYLNAEKPEGYKASNVNESLAGYQTGDKAKNKPNIVVIMNEAYSDLGILGDFTASEDYMPFTHSLQQGAENTVTGYLDVSVLGGNTANSEFEFLTGNTMAFLTQGSVAYQQYIRHDIPSIVKDLKAQGYDTVAMHPYRAKGWNRNTVYPYLGFDKMLFQPDFVNPQMMRTYVSDQSCMDKIKELYENKGENPLFVFNVTMQNHGGYTKESDNFAPYIKVENVDNFATLMYLSLMKESDKALEDLCKYFESQDEDTIIVMFGDHQPSDSVANPLLKLDGKSCSTLTEEEQYLRYQVPVIIWANFDIEEEQNVEMSLNYLGGYLFEKAGLPLSAYQNYLKGLQQEYPVVSAKRICDAAGKNYHTDALSLELKDDFLDYKRFQYYNLFDAKK